jgi:hypothetical protein
MYACLSTCLLVRLFAHCCLCDRSDFDWLWFMHSRRRVPIEYDCSLLPDSVDVRRGKPVFDWLCVNAFSVITQGSCQSSPGHVCLTSISPDAPHSTYRCSVYSIFCKQYHRYAEAGVAIAEPQNRVLDGFNVYIRNPALCRKRRLLHFVAWLA